MPKKILQGGGGSFYNTTEVDDKISSLLTIKTKTDVMDTTNLPYTASRLIYRRQLNIVEFQLENFNFETSWTTPANFKLFTIAVGYRPINELIICVFSKDEPQYASLSLYINTAGEATWGWGKYPSVNYSVPYQSLSCSASWITNDAMPT